MCVCVCVCVCVCLGGVHSTVCPWAIRPLGDPAASWKLEVEARGQHRSSGRSSKLGKAVCAVIGGLAPLLVAFSERRFRCTLRSARIDRLERNRQRQERR